MSKKQLHQIEYLLHRLDAAVVVRDPGNAHSAEAYDGLRKQIIRSGTNHRAHLAHLLALSDSLDRGAGIELIRDRVKDFLAELGVKPITDYLYPDLFDIIETIQGEQDGVEVLEPAVAEQMDDGNFNPIRKGKVRLIKGPEFLPPSDSETSTVLHEPMVITQPGSRTLTILVTAGIALVIGLVLGMLFSGDDSSKTDPPVKTTIPLEKSEVSTPTTLPSTSTTPAITTTTGA
jgi:hypothetical protein